MMRTRNYDIGALVTPTTHLPICNQAKTWKRKHIDVTLCDGEFVWKEMCRCAQSAGIAIKARASQWLGVAIGFCRASHYCAR